MISIFFDTGVRRSPPGGVGHAVKAVAAGTAVWTVYAAAFSRADSLTLIMTFLSLMLVLTFMMLIFVFMMLVFTHVIIFFIY